MTQYHHIILPRLEISGANAQPTPWLLAPPPLTAYQGFAHALALALGVPQHAGFALIHHDIEYLGDVINGALHPHQLRGAQLIDHRDFASATPHILASQPSARCRVTVSMIIRFDADLALAEHHIESFLRGGRIAGGPIISHKFSVRDSTLIRPNSYFTSDIASRIGSGFGVHEREDLLEMQDGDKDRLDPFIRVITRPFPSLQNADDDSAESRQWILPSVLGYIRLSDCSPRQQVRQGLPHAFAEPLIGFVEYRSLRRQAPPFWRPYWPHQKAFAVSTKALVTPSSTGSTH